MTAEVGLQSLHIVYAEGEEMLGEAFMKSMSTMGALPTRECRASSSKKAAGNLEVARGRILQIF
jgi:hypothetical protein